MEAAVDDSFERGDRRIVDTGLEELHVFGGLVEHVAEDPFQEPLSQFHVIGQLEKSHFRLDHPELGQMARGVGILGPESRAEGVDLAQATGKYLALQLAADGQVGRLVEKVFRIVDFAVQLGNIGQIERGDLEHLAGPFAVAGSDDRRVDVQEAFFLEEIVDRAGHAISQPGDGAERIGPRSQMGNRPQELERVLLLLQGVRFGVGIAVDDHRGGLHLGGLPLGRRGFDHAFHRNARTGAELFDFAIVVRQRGFRQDLDIALARTVVHFQEAETGLRIAPGADPTLQFDLLADRRRLTGLGNAQFFHGLPP